MPAIRTRPLFVLLALLAALSQAHAQTAPQRFTLDNGLRVTLWATPGAAIAAVLVLYDIGERHDPPGRSGVAHLLEHLLVTAATRASDATTIEQLAVRYDNQFNAQTGEDYTLLAGVVKAAELEEELHLAAARMASLRVTREDLNRELPRVEAELRNMWGEIPWLGLMNRTRHAILPAQPGARKGGVIEQIRDIPVEELQRRHDTLYRAANARLIVVGGFEAPELRTRVEDLFGALPAGERIGEPAARAEPAREMILMSGARESSTPSVCLAFPMPAPTEDDFPAALVIATRLLDRFQPEPRDGRWAPPPAQWSPLDQPEVMHLLLPMRAWEEPEAAIARVDAIVRTIATRPMTRTDASRTINAYGLVLRATPHAPQLAGANPYFAAVALGRTEQMGVPSGTLAARIARVDDEALAACYERAFSPSARGAGVWIAAPRAPAPDAPDPADAADRNPAGGNR